MREILFRGKRTDTGEWVYWNGYGCLSTPQHGKLISGKTGLTSWSYELISICDGSISQYIGLKDRNGKPIFEGDRVVYPDSTSYSSYDDYNEGVVGYDEEVMRFYFTNRWAVEMEDFDVVDGMMVDVEVIGNIHDNPELLEGG